MIIGRFSPFYTVKRTGKIHVIFPCLGTEFSMVGIISNQETVLKPGIRKMLDNFFCVHVEGSWQIGFPKYKMIKCILIYEYAEKYLSDSQKHLVGAKHF